MSCEVHVLRSLIVVTIYTVMARIYRAVLHQRQVNVPTTFDYKRHEFYLHKSIKFNYFLSRYKLPFTCIKFINLYGVLLFILQINYRIIYQKTL